MMNGSILIFDRIINNYIKDLRSEKRIGEQEMVDLLAQTGSFLNKFEGTALTQSKGYVVYTYNRAAAAKLLKVQCPKMSKVLLISVLISQYLRLWNI